MIKKNSKFFAGKALASTFFARIGNETELESLIFKPKNFKQFFKQKGDLTSKPSEIGPLPVNLQLVRCDSKLKIMITNQ